METTLLKFAAIFVVGMGGIILSYLFARLFKMQNSYWFGVMGFLCLASLVIYIIDVFLSKNPDEHFLILSGVFAGIGFIIYKVKKGSEDGSDGEYNMASATEDSILKAFQELDAEKEASNSHEEKN
jgi:hypothetical protein